METRMVQVKRYCSGRQQLGKRSAYGLTYRASSSSSGGLTFEN